MSWRYQWWRFKRWFQGKPKGKPLTFKEASAILRKSLDRIVADAEGKRDPIVEAFERHVRREKGK